MTDFSPDPDSRPSGIQTSVLELRNGPQRFHVGAGARSEVGRLVGERSCVVVTDDTVFGLWAKGLAEQIESVKHVVTIPPGESSKHFEALRSLCEDFLESGLDRGGVVVAIGGGVVTDLAGFGAAIFGRGVEWIAVPTTVVGQIDAAIGGKVGVDLGAVKNAVGNFHPASNVLIDPETLATLPEPEFRAGCAEAWKHALIADAELFDQFAERGEEAKRLRTIDARQLSRLVEIKTEIVAVDEFEAGPRQVLNLGHTIGHAIESELLARGESPRHGECVAIGIVGAARLSVRHADLSASECARIEQALSEFGLPTTLPEQLDADRVQHWIDHDKKKRNGEVKWVLLPEIGRATPGWSVTESAVRDVLRGL